MINDAVVPTSQTQISQPVIPDQHHQNTGLSGHKRKTSALDVNEATVTDVDKAKRDKVREQNRLSMQRFREKVKLKRKNNVEWSKTYVKKIYSDPVRHSVFKANMARYQRNRTARLKKDPVAYEKIIQSKNAGRRRRNETKRQKTSEGTPGETSDSEEVDLELRLGLPTYSQMRNPSRTGSPVELQKIPLDQSYTRAPSQSSRKQKATVLDAGDTAVSGRRQYSRSAASREHNRNRMKQRRDRIKAKGGEAYQALREKETRWTRNYLNKIYQNPEWHASHKAKKAQKQRERYVVLRKDPDEYEKYLQSKKEQAAKGRRTNKEDSGESTSPSSEIDLELRLRPPQTLSSPIAAPKPSSTAGQQSTESTPLQSPQSVSRRYGIKLLTEEETRFGRGKPSDKTMRDRIRMRERRQKIEDAGGETLKRHKEDKAAYMRAYRTRKMNNPATRKEYIDQISAQHRRYRQGLSSRPEAQERRLYKKRVAQRARRKMVKLQKEQQKQQQQG
ncbi:uncharacterized protein FA14DRAFT_155563 [Meira miltonrushii]|uniref:Uncharacterized protein n=1 Tax=Meira miltonrushii TaxID=1280837 RepID=A0A316VJG1_9BASI|nr:uncharacterized protein FA14DRAFT_155563 [Meira miltonrushii]PWN36161.1 hypothetical protein FA14DRAFT_155563 [Meira miltonrushii]